MKNFKFLIYIVKSITTPKKIAVDDKRINQ